MQISAAAPSLEVLPSLAATATAAVDCGRLSPDSTGPECEHRAQVGVGVLVVASAVLLVVVFIAWRLLLRRFGQSSATHDDHSHAPSDR